MTPDRTFEQVRADLEAAGFSMADAFGTAGIDENTTGRENASRRPRGYAEWRPQAKTQVLIRRVLGVLDEYEDHLPLTIRQVFYRLVATAGYPKDENAYGRLSEHMNRARRAGLIPFEAIRDDGIVTAGAECFADPEAFWDDVASRVRDYHRDRQAGQQVAVELWCEAVGMLQQLRKVADRYSVPVYSAGGFVSLTGIRGIADRALARNVPTVLLHVGDYDPWGEQIFEAMAADAAAFVEADRVIETLSIEPVRVALTPIQIATLKLPTAPVKKAKARARRSAAKWTKPTCQLEALAPDVLAKIVDQAIRDELNLTRVDAQIEAEDRDRIALFGALPSGKVRP